jgi:hypothetical protein
VIALRALEIDYEDLRRRIEGSQEDLRRRVERSQEDLRRRVENSPVLAIAIQIDNAWMWLRNTLHCFFWFVFLVNFKFYSLVQAH